MRGKTILITGATNGIGLEASAELARRGGRIVLVGRDPQRTEAAVADVRARSGSTNRSRRHLRKLAGWFSVKPTYSSRWNAVTRRHSIELSRVR